MQLPEKFIQRTEQMMGKRLFAQFCQAMDAEVPVSLRLNRHKMGTSAQVVGAQKRVAWCEAGYYLKSRPSFTFDPFLHAGLYYVQEAASMFLETVLRQLVKKPVVMLDLCAAPGGKSSLARDVLPDGSLLVSNEPLRARANVLVENMQKMGHPDVMVTNNYAADFVKSGLHFDVVLVDAPCSGEGMFRKDHDAISEWSVQNVKKCSQLQKDILIEIWKTLKEDGILIYSTCTYNLEENEDNVAWLTSELGAVPVLIQHDGKWGITGSLSGSLDAPVYRFMPGKTCGEGLFMAVFKKKGGGQVDLKKAKAKADKMKTSLSKPWLLAPGQFDIRQDTDSSLVAIPQAWSSIYHQASANLKVMYAGVKIGKMKGKDLVPDHALALSTALNTAAFPIFELDISQAIAYLRKESLPSPAYLPHGLVLMTFQGVPLGFAKNVGHRLNNLYPMEWKIKSGHIPNENNTILEL